MDGMRLRGRGGCVGLISHEMHLGVDILLPTSSGRSYYLRYRSLHWHN